MDWGTAGQWAGVAAAIVIAVWGAFSSRNDKTLEDLKTELKQDRQDRKTEKESVQSDLRRLFERVDKVEGRVGRLEVEIDHLPTKDEFHELDSKLERMDAKVDSLLDKIGTLVAQYQRAEDRAIQAEGSR